VVSSVEWSWTAAVASTINPGISAAAGLVGVFLGGWIAARSERSRRRAEFKARQLGELYGPLISLRAEIQARSEVGANIGDIAHAEWTRLAERLPGESDEAFRRRLDERSPQFEAIIDDDNRTLRETLIPAYQQMLAILRDKMWLAEPDTRKYFKLLVEFTDVWERHLRGAIPGEVVQAIGHTEAKLTPFYKHIEATLDRLHRELASGQ
jgi:hypothetical protein